MKLNGYKIVNEFLGFGKKKEHVVGMTVIPDCYAGFYKDSSQILAKGSQPDYGSNDAKILIFDIGSEFKIMIGLDATIPVPYNKIKAIKKLVNPKKTDEIFGVAIFMKDSHTLRGMTGIYTYSLKNSFDPLIKQFRKHGLLK